MEILFKDGGALFAFWPGGFDGVRVLNVASFFFLQTLSAGVMLRGDIETTVLGSGSPRQVYLKTQRKSPARAVFHLQL